MPVFFDQSIFRYNDFGYYSSDTFEPGRNLGYRYLISLLGIKNLDAVLPIFLASIVNLSLDIAWIYLLRNYLSLRGIFFFILMLGLHPYAAVYTMKFSSDLFAKIALFFFCKELLSGGFNNVKKKTLSAGEILLWTLLTLVRNSNFFIAAPYFFLKLRNNYLFLIFLITFFSVGFYFVTYSYWVDLHLLPTLPWSPNYLKEILGIENSIIILLAGVIVRALLLFGAREKLMGEGIEQFLVWGTPGLELFIYIFLGFSQFFGFFVAIRFFFKRYGIATLSMLLLLGIYFLTYPHQRYLIPFIPLCLFGLALFFENRVTKRLR
jgi:hypothetical protein